MSILNRIIIFFMPVVPKPIVKIFSKRYVAGDRLEHAVATVKNLNRQGILATMDVLGESTTRAEDTTAYVEEYFSVLQTIADEKLDCNISVKPTQLGLLIDAELCYQNIKKILTAASQLNNFVRIDMENSDCTSATIALYDRLRQEFSNVGIVLQAYMRRSLDDLKQLMQKGANFRLCKGIYVERREIAYKDPQIINDNFALLIETALRSGSYVGIATHDEIVAWHGLRLIDQLKINREQVEFQMLLGVDEQLRTILTIAGHRLRVYVPYGKQWYAYCMRRLKENPKIAMYIIKALFKH
ncbi:MAG: proline dehydrogenase [Calditrichaeota bacterium]|nr:MAG: proline dehydrogenase [Calditrichota bacterium]